MNLKKSIIEPELAMSTKSPGTGSCIKKNKKPIVIPKRSEPPAIL
jgi:hypothetical protein